MIANLAALRYRNVCAEDGGPISVLETGQFDLRGEGGFQANATLREKLAPKRGAKLFSPVDGSGTHRTAVVARHIAVSEAIERWPWIPVPQSIIWRWRLTRRCRNVLIMHLRWGLRLLAQGHFAGGGTRTACRWGEFRKESPASQSA